MKIIICATTSWNLYNSRLALAKSLKENGYEVIMLAPRDEYTNKIIEAGLDWVHFPLKPRSRNIFLEIAAIIFLIRFYRKIRPDIVNHYTPKGVIYGSFAAHLVNIPQIVNTITGLGFVYSGNASAMLQGLVSLLYRISLRKTKIIFQNPDNMRHFLDKGIVRSEDSHLILGSGIDIEKFSPTPEPEAPPCVVMLPSRFVEEKGIRTLVEASALLKERKAPVRIVLVGKSEEDQPTSIPNEDLTRWVNQGLIEWWGWHNEMEKIYPLAHIVCLPTYYMEGIPKSLIEAASSGRPLIATDVPGCREIVLHNENGFLINVKDEKGLADAIQILCEDSKLRLAMGKKSREIAVGSFSSEQVVQQYFKVFSPE